MEDAATAEISRSQVWQWLHNDVTLADTGHRVTRELVERIADEEIGKLLGPAAESGKILGPAAESGKIPGLAAESGKIPGLAAESGKNSDPGAYAEARALFMEVAVADDF